ncbi:N-acetylneuraminate synthase [Amylibacter sp.]|nr:N-acetylneuraminate synthase [Amylibacter sp.]
MNAVEIIAEAGVNHNGDIKLALALVDAAAESGADYVKFQTFSAAKVASFFAEKAKYQLRTTSSSETQLSMLKKLELGFDKFSEIKDRCDKKNIGFLTSAFDLDSVTFVENYLQSSKIKLGSGEITNGPILLKVGRSGMDVILSTGMSTLSEIEEALSILAFAMTKEGKPQNKLDYSLALLEEKGWEKISKKVTLLHCTTEYPAKIEDTNLNAIKTLKHAFGLPVGFSDHTSGATMAIGATILGASVIEKHITLDNSMEGPDHGASLNPDDFKNFVQQIRDAEAGMGTGIKIPSPIERQNRSSIRKSIVAAKNLRKGQVLGSNDITTKRIGVGISPMLYWDLIGRTIKSNIDEDKAILESDFE